MTGAPPAQPVWRETRAGVAVAVKVQPRARRPGVGGAAPGIDGPRLRIAVTEAAEDGAANRAACAALARALGLPAASVAVAAGATNREKTLSVAARPVAVALTLERLVSA